MSAEVLRLHISPFTPTLVDSIIPPQLRQHASGLSFHTIETFPEKSFGFVELPTQESKALKAKLNGATLRGCKMSVDEARPPATNTTDHGRSQDRSIHQRSKQQISKESQSGSMTGHRIEQGRRIKRGWANETNKRATRRGQGSSQEEDMAGQATKMLFKTRLPPNARSADTSEGNRSKKRKRADGQVVVKEFSRSKRIPLSAISHTPMVPGDRPQQTLTGKRGKSGIEAAPTERRSSSLTVSESASETSSSEGSEDMATITAPSAKATPPNHKPSHVTKADTGSTSSSTSSDDDSESGRGSIAESIAKETHPLEVLFKRSATEANDSGKHKPTKIDTSFSFFDNDVNEDTEMSTGNAAPPQTPHTRRDLEWRGIRSAAPTPDTAAIGRHFSLPPPPEDDEDDSDEHQNLTEDHSMVGTTSKMKPVEEERPEESAFRKWFYENRGDLNRSWKKRRREAKKMNRKRENQRLNRKVA